MYKRIIETNEYTALTEAVIGTDISVRRPRKPWNAYEAVIEGTEKNKNEIDKLAEKYGWELR